VVLILEDYTPRIFYCRRIIRCCIESPVHLGKIQIFPIKSLDAVLVQQAQITKGGILENDRIYAIFDKGGKVVNGKRTARVHELRCEFDSKISEIRLWQNGESLPTQFQLDAPEQIEKWLGVFFGFSVTLRRELQKGFPDDREAFGPTIVSEASLREIRKWFPELSLESLRRRFRTNLELTGGETFCEDRLFGAPAESKPFQIGDVKFFGHNPCQRCVVPTRDPDSGQTVANFQKKFMAHRKQSLPEWANAQRFSHFYRFAVNTSIPSSESGKILKTGDAVKF
jgi:MOSC domain-containing protein